jgi:hypothetical protein
MFTHVVRRRGPAVVGALAALALGAALTLVWGGRAGAGESSPSSPAAVITSFSNVPVGKADAVYAGDSACSCAPTYHPMPDMSKTFTLGGTVSRPVIVLFQGAFHSFSPGVTVWLRLAVDGVQIPPNDTLIPRVRPSGEPDERGTHGFNFVTPRLAPGTHTATILWQDNGVNPGFVSQRSLIIMHN